MNKRTFAALLLALVCLLASCGQKPAEPAAPADMGTKVLELKKDEDNMFPVTVEAIAAQMSGVRSLSFEAVPDLGESPEPYLLNSYQMAALVTDTEIVPGDERLHPNDERSYCLLLFDDRTHLSGMFVGVPERDGDVCRMEVRLMDHDFSALVDSEKEAFAAASLELGKYIPPYEAARSGARWYLEGYETGTGGDILEDPIQTYHLWRQRTSDHFQDLCLDILRFDFSHAEGDYVGYLLFDKEYNPVGHTVVEPLRPGPVRSAPPTLNEVNFDLQLGPDGTSALSKELLDLSIMNIRNVAAFYTPTLGEELDDYLLASDAAPAVVAGWTQFESAVNFDPRREGEELCLFLFDAPTHLMGWYVGTPRQIGADRYSIRINLCDYDFAPLIAEKQAAYESEKASLFEFYFTPEEAQQKAARCLRGFGVTHGAAPMDDDAGPFHMWLQLRSPYLDKFALPTDVLIPDEGQRTYDTQYLLLDENDNLIGYTAVEPEE